MKIFIKNVTLKALQYASSKYKMEIALVGILKLSGPPEEFRKEIIMPCFSMLNPLASFLPPRPVVISGVKIFMDLVSIAVVKVMN